MLRSQDQKTAFTPQNDPSRNQWVFADLEAMAQSSGAQPILVDEIYCSSFFSRHSARVSKQHAAGNAGQIAQRLSHGVPVGRAATIEIRNQHLTYAFTWSVHRTTVSFARRIDMPCTQVCFECGHDGHVFQAATKTTRHCGATESRKNVRGVTKYDFCIVQRHGTIMGFYAVEYL